MWFAELRHQVQEAHFHLDLYNKYMLQRNRHKELALIAPTDDSFIHHMRMGLQAKQVAKGHIDQYNLIMIHLHSLYPAKRTLNDIINTTIT